MLKVAILGFTFKENCPDTRNTKIIDIVRELNEYGIDPMIADPTADAAEAKRLYGVDFVPMDAIKEMDAVVLAVAHTEFAYTHHGADWTASLEKERKYFLI